MNEVQWDVLDALLQMLLGKGLISRTVYDKSHEKILGTLDFPPFFWDNEAGKEQIDITYTYDINALLEVEAKIVSTGETITRLIKNQENSMTEEEMKARMKELSYLKIPPREQEKNKVLLLRGERLYEETTGELREQLEMVTQQFERILDRQDPLKIEEARKDYEEALDWIEEEMWV